MAKPEYWQFVCNPSHWDIQRKLLSDEIYDDWVISKSHKDFFAVGQLGFIRVVGQGKKTVKKLNKLKRKKIEPGYYALVEVVEIFYGETSYPNFWINPTGNDKDWRVKIKILNNYLKKPLKIEKLKKINFDFDRVVFNPTQGKPNNPLSKNTFDKLYELAEGKTSIWLDDVITALKNLGGEAHLSDIFKEVKRIRKKSSPSWTRTIQKELERHSSDSKVWVGKYKGKEDLFYSAKGIGQGVWGLRNFKGIGIRNVFFKLGTQYQREKKRTDKGSRPIYIPKGNEFAKWITRDIPKIIEGLYKKEIEGLEVHSSAGQSSWVTSPWIVVLDPKTCIQPNGRVSVQAGFYPGYSFSQDEKTISLFLGQGEYNVRKNYPKDVDHMLITRAIILRNKVPEYKKFFMDVSKSNVLKESIMKDRWVKSSAFGTVYKTHNLPSEEKLRKDLVDMIRLYKLAIDRGGVSETKKQHTSFDQDQLSAGFEKKVLKHINNENEIIQIDPKFIKQLKKDSDYTCQACGLKYDKVYGDYSKKKDFIEAHHIEPKFKAKEKAEMNKKIKRSAKDFAMLCANCHRMIHRMMRKEKDRVISLKEFKSKINEKFKENIKNLN